MRPRIIHKMRPAVHSPAFVLDAHGGPSRSSTIELRTNGTGTFTRVPVWTGIGTCANDNTAPYSGEVTWTAHDEHFTVDADGKPLTLWADTGFMALDWSKLMVDVCGTEAHSTALLPYDGSPATGVSRGS